MHMWRILDRETKPELTLSWSVGVLGSERRPERNQSDGVRWWPRTPRPREAPRRWAARSRSCWLSPAHASASLRGRAPPRDGGAARGPNRRAGPPRVTRGSALARARIRHVHRHRVTSRGVGMHTACAGPPAGRSVQRTNERTEEPAATGGPWLGVGMHACTVQCCCCVAPSYLGRNSVY